MTLAGVNVPSVPTPDRRRLRTFAFDPMSTRLSGRYLVLDVPFETNLQPGPCGSLLQVVDFDAARPVVRARRPRRGRRAGAGRLAPVRTGSSDAPAGGL